MNLRSAPLSLTTCSSREKFARRQTAASCKPCDAIGATFGERLGELPKPVREDTPFGCRSSSEATQCGVSPQVYYARWPSTRRLTAETMSCAVEEPFARKSFAPRRAASARYYGRLWLVMMTMGGWGPFLRMRAISARPLTEPGSPMSVSTMSGVARFSIDMAASASAASSTMPWGMRSSSALFTSCRYSTLSSTSRMRISLLSGLGALGMATCLSEWYGDEPVAILTSTRLRAKDFLPRCDLFRTVLEQ